MPVYTPPSCRRIDQEQDKAFFGAHLNMARHNAFITLSEIAQRAGVAFTTDDGDMLNSGLFSMLRNNHRPEAAQQIMRMIDKAFPFIPLLAAVLDKKRRSKGVTAAHYVEVFTTLLLQLNNYRNFFSHAVHQPTTTDAQVTGWLRDIFDAARLCVKERFQFTAIELEHLVHLTSKCPPAAGRKPEIIEKTNFHYAFANNQGDLSEKGLAFFICLWLERKQARHFLNYIKGFKAAYENKLRATFEAYVFHSIRLPRPRLESDHTQASLLLDMVNELSRCPHAIFDLLSDADKKKFVPPVVQEKEALTDVDTNPFLSIHKRHGNRFYYFALKYLDLTAAFKFTRFHIDLGNYCFKVYDQSIDNENRKRRWIKKMKGFGRLQDFSANNKPASWQQLTLSPEEKTVDFGDPYITDTFPHYHINNHQVGLKLISNAITATWPAVDTDKPVTEKPDMWLSEYELPALLFYHLLQQQYGGPTVEELFTNHRQAINAFLTDVANNKVSSGWQPAALAAELQQRNLQLSQVPEKIVQYLLNKPRRLPAQYALDKLTRMYNETVQLLEKLDRNREGFFKRPGSKDYIPMKPGKMADFLAKDMLLLQPPVNEKDGKANSTEFQVLQSKLALFGVHQPTLYNTYLLCNLVNSPNPHPFLHRLHPRDFTGIFDYYRQYLTERKTFLRACMNKGPVEQYHFLHLGEREQCMQDSDFQALARKLVQETPLRSGKRTAPPPLNLPRGLFLEPIKLLLKEKVNYPALNKVMAETPRMNASYLVEQYFSLVLNDKEQDFYHFGRSYDFLNKLYDPRLPHQKRDALPRRFFTPQQLNEQKQAIEEKANQRIDGKSIAAEKQQAIKAYLHFQDNEKQIRHSKVCDKVLFLLISKLWQTEAGALHLQPLPGGLLQQVSFQGNSQLLNTSVKLQLERHSAAGQVKHIEQTSIKIKDYGNLRRFVKDRRLDKLLDYIAATVIDRKALETELALYEQARIRVCERVIDFEKQVVQLFPDLAQLRGNYVNHYTILKKVAPEESEQFKAVKNLRNSFNHNEYPGYDRFGSLIDGSHFNELAHHTNENDLSQYSIVLQFEKMINQYYDQFIANSTAGSASQR